MTPTTMPSLLPALPEIFLACAAMVLLMYGTFRGNAGFRTAIWLAIGSLAVAFIMLGATPDEATVTFAGMFVADAYARFMKSLVLLGSALALLISLGYVRSERMERFELPVLVLLATTGMLMMVSANDLIALYVGFELQSLSLYVLAAFKRDSARATEAGLKYFVLGALSSAMLLYGCSMIYGFAGSTNFTVLAELFESGRIQPSLGLIVGLVFLSAGLAFKVSAVPFHMWTPDVYEGAPTPITAFFAAAPKVAAMALFVRAFIAPFGSIDQQWQQIIVVVSIGSMLLGSLAAINQANIKRLMAYSSIGHVGYALIGLAAGTEEGARGVLIYMAIYLTMTVGTFACILAMRHRGGFSEQIADLAGLARTRPGMAFALAVFMFSLAGVPPLAGFFGKFYVFLAAVNAGLYALAVIGVLSSVIGAYYYLRIVKLMYFDAPAEPFERPMRQELAVVAAGTGIFNLLFFLYPAPLLAGAAAAAQALFR